MAGPTGRQLAKQAGKAGIDFCDLTVRARIVGRKLLYSEWRASVYTDEGITFITTFLDTKRLMLSFSGPLFVNATWPAENAKWRGLTYTFSTSKWARGRVSEIDLWRIPGWTEGDATGLIKRTILATFHGLIAGTNVNKPGYNPLDDPDPSGTLDQIMANLKKNPRIGNIGLKDLTGLEAGVSVSLAQAVKRNTAEGGVEIPKRAYLDLNVELQGTARDVAKGTVRADKVVVKSEDIYLTRGGERLVRLKSVVIHRGGLVQVEKHEGLGAVGTAEGVESLVRLIGIFGAAADGARGNSAGTEFLVRRSISRGHANPSIVKGVTRSQLNKALTKALQEVYSQEYKTIQARMPKGIKLDDVFGINPRRASPK
jgi:hypothetical protein